MLIYLACFAPLAMAARAGVRSVTIEQINAAYSMGRQWRSSGNDSGGAAEILTGMRRDRLRLTTLSPPKRGGDGGLSQMVLNASNFLRTDVVIMGIVVIGVVAYLFDLLMRFVERRLVPWKGRV